MRKEGRHLQGIDGHALFPDLAHAAAQPLSAGSSKGHLYPELAEAAVARPFAIHIDPDVGERIGICMAYEQKELISSRGICYLKLELRLEGRGPLCIGDRV